MKNNEQFKRYYQQFMALVLIQSAVLFTACDQSNPQVKPPENDPVDVQPEQEVEQVVAKMGVWNSNFKAVEKLAKAKKLPIFINFSASDFSPSCKYMKNTVFDSEEWGAYAAKNFILMQSDLPAKKSLISPELFAQNKRLREKFKIEHNTVFLIIEEGEVRGRLVGERNITAKRFVEQVDAILNPKRLKAITLKAKNGVRAEVLGDDDFYLPNTTRKFTVKESGAELGEWSQDLEASIALAKKTGKPILLNFTDGSEACEYMDRIVFKKISWQQFAEKELILMTVKLSDKDVLNDKIKTRNTALADRFSVKILGYPTFILMDSSMEKKIAIIRNSLSARDFRKNVIDAINLQESKIDERTVELGSAGFSYRKLMQTLRQTLSDYDDLFVKIQKAFHSGADVTDADQDKLKELEAKVSKLNKELEEHNQEYIATTLEREDRQRFKELTKEKLLAKLRYEQWMATSPEDTQGNRDKMAFFENAIKAATRELYTLESKPKYKQLTAGEQEQYKKVRAELIETEDKFDKWLSGDPGESDASRKTYRRFTENIEHMQDQLDRILSFADEKKDN